MRGIEYFIACLIIVVVVGFVYSKIGNFVRKRADKMGRGHKKGEEIELCQKKRN